MASLYQTLAFLFLTAALANAAEIPTVGIYLIRKYGDKVNYRGFPEVILELSNPTSSTFYITGDGIESPNFETEAQRDGRWLRIPNLVCTTCMSTYPFHPGAKMLVTVFPPWDEAATRYRFLFRTSDQAAEAKLISVWSPPIERKDLGDMTGTIGELTSDKKLEEPISDEQYNQKPKAAAGTFDDDPFGAPPSK